MVCISFSKWRLRIMLRILILLLIIVPASEIGLLILSGKTFGVWPTILLIISTGVLGAWLAKKQGLQTLVKAQEQIRFGRVPSEAILDGVCVLVGGVFLLTPGFISDVLGFLLLIPITRQIMKPFLIKIFKKIATNGNFFIFRR